MSYLNPVRLHFSGKFLANVSTVNNDPGHFNNATFQSSFQKLGQGMTNGWFNPQGDASFRLLGCRVTSAWADGAVVPEDDTVLACGVADADSRVSAKLVDLDPEQQLVSQIWGLQVRLVDGNGTTLLRGSYTPAAFCDIWSRAAGSSDIAACAAYQSVLTDLEWGDLSGSAFLRQLRTLGAPNGTLSIKFNVDAFCMDFSSPDFMCGRLVGSIGPCLPNEPAHLLVGRHFMAQDTPGNDSFFKPVGQINYCPAVIDPVARCLYLDLGNALPTTGPDNALKDLGDLRLGVLDPIATPGAPAGSMIPLGALAAATYAGDPTWYARTAGVVVFALDANQLAAAASAPLALSGGAGVMIGEAASGAWLRADDFVHRLSPGQQVDIAVHAMRWGRPLPGVVVDFKADTGGLQPCNVIDPNDVPPVGTPLAAIPFNPEARTGADGIAWLSMVVGDPGTPRYFGAGTHFGIDGQVYGIRASFAAPQLQGPVNLTDFISILLWSSFTPRLPLTWVTLYPIFKQYANLYPVMNRFLDMGDYGQVVANADLLKLAFGLAPDDPNAMPVTRDMSPAKRQAILAWLDAPLEGPPILRRQPAQSEALSPPADDKVNQGGKATAISRRLIVQQRTHATMKEPS